MLTEAGTEKKKKKRILPLYFCLFPVSVSVNVTSAAVYQLARHRALPNVQFEFAYLL